MAANQSMKCTAHSLFITDELLNNTFTYSLQSDWINSHAVLTNVVFKSVVGPKKRGFK